MSKRIKCTHCNKKFKTVQAMIQHVKAVHSHQKYRITPKPREIKFCPICEGVLRYVLMNGKYIAFCSCGYSELNPSKEKSPKKSYRCFFCGKYFNNPQALHQHVKSKNHDAFKRVRKLKKQGHSLSAMITRENEVPSLGKKRNLFLSFLVKLEQNFECQLCKKRGITATKPDLQVEAHHITPLSKGGRDHSKNLIVLCEEHHKEAHQKDISIELRQAKRFEFKKSKHIITN